jgi:archaemetzincin
MKWGALVIFALAATAAVCLWAFRPSGRRSVHAPAGSLNVALQPLGKVSPGAVETSAAAVRSYYKAKVAILKEVPLPASAYTRPRNRYRAEKLLTFLNGPACRGYDKVIGLTERDISTTKGEVADWGVFGLGSLGGRVCVVSTFRLKPGASQNKALERLKKVVNHELGHTLGLPHCPVPGCMMADAKGTISIVDGETGKLCPACAREVGLPPTSAAERRQRLRS